MLNVHELLAIKKVDVNKETNDNKSAKKGSHLKLPSVDGVLSEDKRGLVDKPYTHPSAEQMP